MASTRATTGNSKPRVFQAISTEPGRKTTGGKKRGPKKATATKAKKPTGVTKKKAPTKRKTSVKDKVEGAAKKAEGKVLNKPGKEGAGTKQMKGTDGKRGRKAKV
jgi:hypothetical protein